MEGPDFVFVRRHLSLANFIVRTRIGVEVRSLGRKLIEDNIAAHASLFGSGAITLTTLLFVRVVDQDTLLGFRIQLPPFLVSHMYIRNDTKNPQMS